jgi:hypothetical protein
MENHAMEAVHEALAKIQEIDIRRNPKSVLAAIIYSITQLPDEKKPLEGLILLLFFVVNFLEYNYFWIFISFMLVASLIPNKMYTVDQSISLSC